MVVHDFDHDLPAEVGLAGQVDPAHAAFADLPLHFVAPEESPPDHLARPP